MSREEATEFTAYVRREGRVTIPKEVRDALIIKEGKLVKYKIIKMRAHCAKHHPTRLQSRLVKTKYC